MREQHWLETLKKRVRVNGYLETRTPLHIGKGQALGATGSDLPIVLDSQGFPVIPGSSFKGVLRAQVEALIRGLEEGGNHYLRACDVISEDYCVHRSEWNPKPGETNAQWLERMRRLLNDEQDGICHVCRLFGAPYIAGKLYVADLVVIAETWAPFLLQVRDGVAIDRESLTAASRKKFDFEIVPPGVRFKLELVLDNPKDYELGLLLRALQLFSEGMAFLGGQTSRGTGRVHIPMEQLTLTVVTPESFLKGEEARPQPLSQVISRYSNALRAKVEGTTPSERGETGV